jgi:hypothetical protein
MAENRDPNARAGAALLLPGPLLSPTLLRNNRSLVRENARLLLGRGCARSLDADAPAESPQDLVAALRGSRRFHDLVSTIAQQRSSALAVRAGGGVGAAGVGSEEGREALERAFSALQQHAAQQQHALHQLQRSLAVWRRWRLSQNLVHWHRTVVESAFDALASAFDRWRHYLRAKSHSRMLEDRLAALQRTLRRALLEHCLHWWSLMMYGTHTVGSRGCCTLAQACMTRARARARTQTTHTHANLVCAETFCEGRGCGCWQAACVPCGAAGKSVRGLVRPSAGRRACVLLPLSHAPFMGGVNALSTAGVLCVCVRACVRACVLSSFAKQKHWI